MIGAVSSIGGRNVYFNPYNNQDAQRVQQAQDARPIKRPIRSCRSSR